MKNYLIGALTLVTFAGALSVAQAASDSDWQISPFKTETVEIAVATDKTGHKMHVMRTKNGTMMAIVPAEPIWAMMKTNQDFLQ